MSSTLSKIAGWAAFKSLPLYICLVWFSLLLFAQISSEPIGDQPYTLIVDRSEEPLLALSTEPPRESRSVEERVAAPRVEPAEPKVVESATVESARVESGGFVAVNRATVDDLVALRGIGPVLAQRIVEERERRGGFKTLAELQEVRGIGPKLMESLSASVIID